MIVPIGVTRAPDWVVPISLLIYEVTITENRLITTLTRHHAVSTITKVLSRHSKALHQNPCLPHPHSFKVLYVFNQPSTSVINCGLVTLRTYDHNPQCLPRQATVEVQLYATPSARCIEIEDYSYDVQQAVDSNKGFNRECRGNTWGPCNVPREG